VGFMDRRRFIVETGRVAGGAVVGLVAAGAAPSQGAGSAAFRGSSGVSLVRDPADPIASAGPALWAMDQIEAALGGRSVSVHRYDRLDEARREGSCLVASGCAAPVARENLGPVASSLAQTPESLALVSGASTGRPILLASGGDTRGLVYALLEVADRV